MAGAAPLISVLTALRNGVGFLPECVKTVRRQTDSNWEHIIGVNGWSPESPVYSLAATFAGARTFALDLHHCRNKPQSLAEMVGKSSGDYIAVLDVDDLWHPAKLERQRPLLADNAVVGILAEYFGDATGPVGTPAGAVTFDMLLEANCIVNSSAVIRRDLAVWPDTDKLDDYPLWLRLASEKHRLLNLGECLTYIRCHSGQWFGGRDNAEEVRAEWRAKGRG